MARRVLVLEECPFATRFPSTCGVADPPFTSTDVFSLDIVMGPRLEAPYNGLSLQYEGGVVVGRPIALSVEPFQAHGSQIGDGPWFAAQDARSGPIALGYAQGADPSDFDRAAFDSVTITFEAIPAEDGQPLTARLQVHFTDGRRLDETFSADLESSEGGCGAPAAGQSP